MRNGFFICWLSFAVVSVTEAAETVLPPASSVPACKLLETYELESYLEAPVAVSASSGAENEVGLCTWAGRGSDASVSVLFFPGVTHGLPQGMERTQFDKMMEGEKSKHEPGEFVAVPELADDAWVIDLADNPTQHFSVYLIKGTDNATITTNGVGLEATVEIARYVASRM